MKTDDFVVLTVLAVCATAFSIAAHRQAVRMGLRVE